MAKAPSAPAGDQRAAGLAMPGPRSMGRVLRPVEVLIGLSLVVESPIAKNADSK